MNSTPTKRRRGVLEPTIFAIVGVIILIGLGIWQLDRKQWRDHDRAAVACAGKSAAAR
jgi:cytochrome oxidase assembly protein ShyY1